MDRNISLSAAVYSPRPSDIGTEAADHGGMRLTITNRFYILAGDPRFTNPGSDYGTLTEQAAAMRKLATAAATIAAALEARARTEDAARHPFAEPGQVAPHLPAPDKCMQCGQPAHAHTIPAPEEANGGTQLDNSTEDDPTDADQQAADALPFSYLACGDSLAYAAPIEPGTKAECPLHGETAVVAAPVTAPQRAVQA